MLTSVLTSPGLISTGIPPRVMTSYTACDRWIVIAAFICELHALHLLGAEIFPWIGTDLATHNLDLVSVYSNPAYTRR